MRLGVVVDGQSADGIGRATALGASAISVRLHHGSDLKGYLRMARRGHSLGTLGIVDRQTFRARVDWHESLATDLDWVMELVEGGYLDALALGHEPDDGFASGASDDPLVTPRGGVGSWALPMRDLAELVIRCRARMRELPFPIPLVLGGLCSWRADVLERLDLALLDGVLLHPYGPTDASAATIGAYLDAIGAVLGARGLRGRVRLGIGELGRSDQQEGRGRIADWFSEALQYLSRRDDVDCCFVCCDADATLDGYGQFDIQDRAKPAVAAIYAVGHRLPADEPLFRLPADTPSDTEPTDADTTDTALPWADPYFTPDGVARALASVDPGPDDHEQLTALVAGLWPEFEPYLAEQQVPDDPAPRAALLAAIYIATGGRFAPTTEGGSYARLEHRYGAILGNWYYGDGYRYRGRGLVRIRGRAAYSLYRQLLDLPLLDEPDLVTEPAVAAGITATLFGQQHLFEAAVRGDWVAVWRAISPSLSGYYPFLRAVQALLGSLDDQADVSPVGPPPQAALAAFEAALTRIGDPYRPGGDRPGGFDALGLVTWAYAQAGQDLVPGQIDTLFDAGQPLSTAHVAPGDLVFYEYGDPANGGARFDHVGLASGQGGLILDARVGVGVGYRPHVRGALRRYRRLVVAEVAEEGDDEAMWQERYEALKREVDRLADRLEVERANLRTRPAIPDQPTEKAAKKEWVAWGRTIHRWNERQQADLNGHTTALAKTVQDLWALGDERKEVANGESESEVAAERERGSDTEAGVVR